jgi:hypothetical protein
MLASITPLGERGRHSSYGLTVSAFIVGSTAAGAACGAVAGGLGRLVLGAAPSGSLRAGILAAALLAGLVADVLVRGERLPGPHRQVSEAWLMAYRGWVYGAGFGAQLGAGLATRVNSSAVYVAVIAAFLAAGAAAGALVLGCFGLVRGVSLLLGAGVRTPSDLAALHRRLARSGAGARRGALALQGLLAVALIGAAL